MKQQMNVNLIYAKSKNNVIGNKGTLPWHIPEDLKYFNTMTSGAPVIMGSKTWQSLPDQYRPLPGRVNAVLTTNASLRPEIVNKGGMVFVNEGTVDIESVIRYFKGAQCHSDIWIIGGNAIYKQALPYAKYAYVTEIEAEYVGDTFAPVLSPSDWVKVSDRQICSKTAVTLNFCVYENLHPRYAGINGNQNEHHD